MRSVVVVLCCLVAALMPLWLSPTQTRLFTEMLYLSLFAISFCFLLRYLGLLSFGHALCFGFGAYAVAFYFNSNPDGSVWIAFLLAIGTSVLASTVSGLLLMRLKGGYFALMTMAICQLAFFVASKWRAVTRGEDGLMISIPQITLPGIPNGAVSQSVLLCWIALAVLMFGAGMLAWYLRTPLGRATILLRENESRAAFLGYETRMVKLAAFNAAGIAAGMAGALSALYQGFVSPAVFGFDLSGDVIMMTLIGGSGTFIGPAFGAAIYTGLVDALPGFTEHPRMFIALLFVALVLFAPTGISGLLNKIQNRRRTPKQDEVAV